MSTLPVAELPTEAATPKARPRFGFIDTMRGLVMFLVVYYHVAGGVASAGMGMPKPLSWIVGYCFSFFMPLMFLLSGVFIESAIKRGPRDYALTRLKTLVYPFVLWTAVNGSTQVFASRYSVHPFDSNPLAWLLWAPVAPLWFFEALIVSQAIYGALRFLGLGRTIVFGVALGLTVLSVLLPYDMFSRSLGAFGFFALGSFASDFLLHRLPQANKTMLVAIAAAFEAVHVMIIDGGWPYVLSPAVALIGSIPVLLLGAAFGEARAFSPLRTLGNASIAIFVMHMLFTAPSRLVLQKAFHVNAPILHLVVGMVVGIAFPLLVWKRVAPLFPWLFRWPEARRTA